MTYLCMIFFDPHRLDTLPSDELASLGAAAAAYDDELRTSGHLLAAHRLERPQAAATVRIRNGHASPTDGPFAAGLARPGRPGTLAATKEQIGGVLLLDARDLNEAIQIASRLPIARFGAVEVRPVKEPPTGRAR